MSASLIDKAGEVRSGSSLDEDALRTYLATIRPEWDSELTIKQFPGGHSNLTFLIDVAGDEIVLRHPPRGIKIKSGHDMGREYRVISQLHPVFPKVPEPYFFCEDDSIIGVPFYGMERVKGIIMRKQMPEGMPKDEQTIQQVVETFIETLVQLHQVDYKTAGLADLGRPEGYIERQ
ncbi:MAG: phosphotransferase family protein, partial [Calditrichota bacterium]